MRRNLWLVALPVLFVLPITVRSQTAEIASGDKLRLSARTLGTVSRVGILTKLESDKLLLTDTGQGSNAWEIQLDRLTQLEVRLPNAGNRKHRGALIGMITGFVLIGGLG